MTWCKWETSLRVTPFQISEVKNLNLLEVWGLRAPWILDQIPAGFFLGAKRTVHERASFDSLQFTHCTRTTDQCRTTQRGKSQFDTCQHPLCHVTSFTDYAPKSWRVDFISFYVFIISFTDMYVYISYIYITQSFQCSQTRPPLPRCFLMRPRAAGEGAATFGNGPFQRVS